ncbi:MAG: hypothetical protein C0426_00250 [Rhodobacter sp.]|nr:hypothetical protein [Rhodobacter sp.]
MRRAGAPDRGRVLPALLCRRAAGECCQHGDEVRRGHWCGRPGRLRFDPWHADDRACHPGKRPLPVDAVERRLRAMLDATRAYRIDGQRMTLLDGEGATLAVLAAVYLR